ncbi:MAG: hypothetical protein L6300_18925 [Syntrophaceae bacterium]|nr:hypothetical protein [Syntrophaceae bacterium]
MKGVREYEKVGGKEPRGTATTAAGAAPAASADEAPSPDAGAAKGIGTDQQKQTEEGAQLSSIEESKNG